MTHAGTDPERPGADQAQETPQTEESGPLPDTTDDDGKPVDNPSGG